MTVQDSLGLFSKFIKDVYDVLYIFFKKIKNKFCKSLVSIRSYYRFEFQNAKFLEYYVADGIDHNFSPKTSQQNIVVG